jgi:hypothetical protein
MISIAFLGLAVQAAPQHMVGGGLFGPGVAPGPTNPANIAEFVFYSPNQLGHALLTGATSLDPANGTAPAIWSKEVGDTWTWVAGEQIVVVAETRRGVATWTGTNRTSSIDGVLQVGGLIQDLGNGTLEALPTVTATAGPDNVLVSWAGLQDGNGNIASYEVFHEASMAGPWATAVARVANGTTPSANHTSLAPGMHCYAVGVNYRRDLAGGVYTTQGLSEPVCATIVDLSPTIVSTSPTDGATGVAVTTAIIITFSERMNTSVTSASIAPSLTLTPNWSAGDTVLTLTHATPFTVCTPYAVTVVGSDMTGNPLPPGSGFGFTALCPSPFIMSTTPASGATLVRTDTAIVIRFSEPMATGTVTWTFAPAHTFAWNGPTNDILTLTPNVRLGERLPFTVTVTAGQDLSGNGLVPGPVLNPWTFTTNTLPTVIMDPSNLLVGVCRTGGFSLNIPWTMNDDPETSAANLVVTLRAIGATTTVIAGPTAGLTSPYAWTTPTNVNGLVQILIEVADGVGETAQDTSDDVLIDNIAPTVSTFLPDGGIGVPTDTSVTITFSEAMATLATQGAVVISPSPVGAATYFWLAGNNVLIINATYQATTLYTVTVGTGARDACDPGLTLGAPDFATFTTGAGPKTLNRATNLRAIPSASAIQLTWERPLQYSDGSALGVGDIDYYIVFRATSETGTRSEIGRPDTATFSDTNVQGGVTYYYWVQVVDIQGRQSVLSEFATAQVNAPPDGGFNLLLLLIPLIVILVVLGIWLMRRKPAAAPPPAGPVAAPPAGPGGVGAEEPKGEVAPGESPSEAESGGEFKSCPNCGTMVKPTDAECFVCGAKL